MHNPIAMNRAHPGSLSDAELATNKQTREIKQAEADAKPKRKRRRSKRKSSGDGGSEA